MFLSKSLLWKSAEVLLALTWWLPWEPELHALNNKSQKKIDCAWLRQHPSGWLGLPLLNYLRDLQQVRGILRMNSIALSCINGFVRCAKYWAKVRQTQKCSWPSLPHQKVTFLPSVEYLSPLDGFIIPSPSPVAPRMERSKSRINSFCRFSTEQHMEAVGFGL